ADLTPIVRQIMDALGTIGDVAGFILRPDIVDRTLGAQQYYEIKTEKGAEDGRSDLLMYGILLNMQYPGIVRGNWHPEHQTYGIADKYGIPIPILIHPWWREPGLILYQLTDGVETALKFAIAAEFGVLVATIGEKF